MLFLPARFQAAIRYYSNSLKIRKRAALRWANRIRLSDWKVVELGSGATKTLRVKNSVFYGLPAIGPGNTSLGNSVNWDLVSPPKADLMMFVDLADELNENDLSELFARLPAKRILFSFSEERSGIRYFLLRELEKRIKARIYCYTPERIAHLLKVNGYRHCEIRKLPAILPTCLVFAEKSGRLSKNL